MTKRTQPRRRSALMKPGIVHELHGLRESCGAREWNSAAGKKRWSTAPQAPQERRACLARAQRWLPVLHIVEIKLRFIGEIDRRIVRRHVATVLPYLVGKPGLASHMLPLNRLSRPCRPGVHQKADRLKARSDRWCIYRPHIVDFADGMGPALRFCTLAQVGCDAGMTRIYFRKLSSSAAVPDMKPNPFRARFQANSGQIPVCVANREMQAQQGAERCQASQLQHFRKTPG